MVCVPCSSSHFVREQKKLLQVVFSSSGIGQGKKRNKYIEKTRQSFPNHRQKNNAVKMKRAYRIVRTMTMMMTKSLFKRTFQEDNLPAPFHTSALHAEKKEELCG